LEDEMWSLENYIKKKVEKNAVTVDYAWQNGFFDDISEMVYKDMKGFQTFHSTDPESMYNFMKDIGVSKFIPWSYMCINDNWELFHNFSFKMKGRRKKKGKIPQSQRDKIDTTHKKIKGQKSKDFY
jgi:hypothetical protein